MSSGGTGGTSAGIGKASVTTGGICGRIGESCAMTTPGASGDSTCETCAGIGGTFGAITGTSGKTGGIGVGTCGIGGNNIEH